MEGDKLSVYVRLGATLTLISQVGSEMPCMPLSSKVETSTSGCNVDHML